MTEIQISSRENVLGNLPNELRFGANYIAGEWKEIRQEMAVFDPSMNKAFSAVPISTNQEIDEAVESAHEAQKIWSKWSWPKRGDVIYDMIRLVEDHREILAQLISVESGKQINEARADVTEGIHMLQYSASMGRHPVGYKLPSEIAEKEMETIRVPRGVCAVITPWNFPLAIPTWLISPALMCGNAVLFKPSEETPLVGQYLVQLFHQAAKKHNVPRGVLNLLHGRGEVGERLARHEGIRGILFTGSHAVGKKLRRIAAEHFDKFAICEMGGKNSMLILEDSDLDNALNAAALSCYKTTHQRCVSADTLIVQESIVEKFAEKFVGLTKRIKFGDPLDPNVFAGPLINQKAIQKFNNMGALGRTECDQVLLQGFAKNHSNFPRPNIFLTKYRPQMDILKEEFFTPNVVIVPVRDFEEAMMVANAHEYGLAMSLFTRDPKKEHEFKQRAVAGLKYIRLPTIGAEVQGPFGGLRRSGTGTPSAAWLFNYLTHETVCTTNYGDEIQMAQGLSARV